MGFVSRADSKRKENIMRTTKLRNPMLTNLVLIALSILVAPAVKAECGAAAHNETALAPELRDFQEPAAQDDGRLFRRSWITPRLQMRRSTIQGLLSWAFGRWSLSLEG